MTFHCLPLFRRVQLLLPSVSIESGGCFPEVKSQKKLDNNLNEFVSPWWNNHAALHKLIWVLLQQACSSDTIANHELECDRCGTGIKPPHLLLNRHQCENMMGVRSYPSLNIKRTCVKFCVYVFAECINFAKDLMADPVYLVKSFTSVSFIVTRPDTIVMV